MPPKLKVPFEVSAALTLRANVEVEGLRDASLGPDGALLALVRPDPAAPAELCELSLSGERAWSLAPPTGSHWQCAEWCSGGARVLAWEHFWRGEKLLGRLQLRDRGGSSPAVLHDTSGSAGVTLSPQVQGSPVAALSPDEKLAALRVRDAQGEAEVLVLELATGAARRLTRPEGQRDFFAHCFDDEGLLYVATSSPGEVGGVRCYEPQSLAQRAHWKWTAGCALTPARRGVWAAGVPHFAWRIDGEGEGLVRAEPAEWLAYGEALRAKASKKAEVSWLEQYLGRLASGQQRLLYQQDYYSYSQEAVVPPAERGARGYGVPIPWATGFAQRLGEDGLVLSDGLRVFLLRERGGALERTELLSDPKGCAPASVRVASLSVCGARLGLLWHKGANGKGATFSVFDVNA